MRRILYTILLAIDTLPFSSCTDYINVDRYFYDQVSLNSAFSKRVYVDGWSSSAYSVMDYIGEYREPFRWASDNLYHPNMKNYVEGNYSADNQLSDKDQNESRLREYYEGIRRASTFIQSVDRCSELTMGKIADMKGQARFLHAYCYQALIRVYGPVSLIPSEGLDVNLSYEELSLSREHSDNLVDFIDQELAESARSLPTKRTVDNLGRPTRGVVLGLRSCVLLYTASPLFSRNTDFFNVKDCYGDQLVSQTHDETKRAKAAVAAKDVVELAEASGLYELYVVMPKATVLPSQRPPHNASYLDKNCPEGRADINPLLSYKSNFDGTILGSGNPEPIFTRTRIRAGHIDDWTYRSTPKASKGNNRLTVTQKQIDAYAMNDGRSITEVEATGDYVAQGSTTQVYAVVNLFLPTKVNLMYNNHEPRFYAFIAYNDSVREASSASEPEFRDQQIFYHRGLNDGRQGFEEECPLIGVTLKKFYNSEDSRTEGGYLVDKIEVTTRYGEIFLIYAEALNKSTSGQVYHLTTYTGVDIETQHSVDEMRYVIKYIRIRAGVSNHTEETYNNPNDFRVKLERECQIGLLGENSMRYFDLRRWKDAMTEENRSSQECNISIGDDETCVADFYRQTIIISVCKVFEQKIYLWSFPTYRLRCSVSMTQNPEW